MWSPRGGEFLVVYTPLKATDAGWFPPMRWKNLSICWLSLTTRPAVATVQIAVCRRLAHDGGFLVLLFDSHCRLALCPPRRPRGNESTYAS